ncbi:MAG: ion channel [Pseudomonadota bacterium]
MLLENLLISGGLVILTSMVHFLGLTWLSSFMTSGDKPQNTVLSVTAQGLSILFVVLMLFVFHAFEVWIYACLYLFLGVFTEVEEALYFSASTFTTVGFGDLVLNSDWRMLAAWESMNGFLLIGWSTAFLVSVTSRVRAFEANVDRLDEE